MKAYAMKMRGLLLVVVGMGLAAGCGKKEEETGPPQVQGSVTLADGRPLPGGWIAFHGKDAFETCLAPIEAGKFTAYGVPTGNNVRVTIDVRRPTAEAQDLDLRLRDAQTRADLVKRTGKVDSGLGSRVVTLEQRRQKLERLRRALQAVKVDDKYLLKETTPLSYSIHAGKQTIDIALQP
jgi:hypothetical protein